MTALDRTVFQPPQPVVLDNCRLFDGVNPLTEDAAVAVGEGRVAYVGSRRELPAAIAGGARQVDVAGAVVMPGLIDCHAHLVYAGFRSLEDVDRSSIETATLNAVLNAKKVIAAGYTAIRDVGTIGNVAVTIRDAVKRKLIRGPRVVASGQILCPTAGLGDTLPPHWSKSHGLGRLVDGPHEIRKAVREQIRNGVDNVKLAASGVEVGPYAHTWMTTFSAEEIAVATEEAHRWGRTVAVHAQSYDSVKFALRAGVDTVEHGTRLDAESLHMFKSSRTILVPTMCTLFSVLELGDALNLLPKHREEMRVNEPLWLKSVKLAYDAGIPIAAGGDLGNRYPHGTNAREIEFLVRAGLSPLDALRAATSMAARAIKQPEIGTLAPGQLADLLIVDGNPLDDVALLQDHRRLIAVIQGGELVGGRLAPAEF
ncbi:MAG: amidohydrolase family protein [Alphaproteobacteria bacterium]|nr:amidohydrolase family protein [Alphaproteobacteria bacterium]